MKELAEKVIEKLSGDEKEDLLFMLLYGSSVKGRGRDYDLILVFKKHHDVRGEFDELDVRYSITKDKLKQIIQTSISMYSVLNDEDAHKVIHGEQSFKKFKKEFIDEFKPSFKTYKRFMLRKNKRETLINGLKERKGERATIWAFHSIRSLLQLIYLKKKNRVTRDMKELIRLVEKKDSKLIKELFKKFKKRKGLDKDEKDLLIKLTKKLIQDVRKLK
ncbi:hypothetical protein GF352_00420 [archaeon]|nr:hypothetical protein [archaeon]